ncbi:hypothetical protein [Sphingopyxis sp. R3-92]
MSQHVDSRLALAGDTPMMAAPIGGMAPASIQLVTPNQWHQTAEIRA